MKDRGNLISKALSSSSSFYSIVFDNYLGQMTSCAWMGIINLRYRYLLLMDVARQDGRGGGNILITRRNSKCINFLQLPRPASSAPPRSLHSVQ